MCSHVCDLHYSTPPHHTKPLHYIPLHYMQEELERRAAERDKTLAQLNSIRSQKDELRKKQFEEVHKPQPPL